MSSWGPDALAEVFLHDVDPLVAAENESFQGAPGSGMFTEPWPLERWPEVPTLVLAPTGDRLFPPDFQRRVAREFRYEQFRDRVGAFVAELTPR